MKIINHLRTVEMKSNEERSLQLGTQFMQLHKKAEKNFRLLILPSQAHRFKSC